jgi:thioesterase domain-containing protein
MENSFAQCEGETVIDRGTECARIVQLRSGSPGPCLFLVPGTGGRIEGFANLAACLRTAMSVFAIEARGIHNSGVPDTSVEEIAIHYLNQMKGVQAAGPYCLVGHSFGGLVVFEIARRLLETGERVACLIMFDTPLSRRYWPLTFYLRNLRARLGRHLTRVFTISVSENLRYYFRRLLSRGYGLNRMSREVVIGRNRARVMIANEIALKQYCPQFYPGKLTFFRTSDREAAGYETLWRNRVRQLEVHSADGDHMSLLDPPNVSLLAADISTCLMKGLEAV